MHLAKAESLVARCSGLIGRRRLSAHDALYIADCRRVHTWFMRFAIDIIFLDEDGVVIKIFYNVTPWHCTDIVRQAVGCIEVSAGNALQCGMRVGKKCIIDSY